MSRSNSNDRGLLFSKYLHEIPEIEIKNRKRTEDLVSSSCVLLKIGYLCADLFALGKFRIMGTIVGSLLLSNSSIQIALCYAQPNESAWSSRDVMRSLHYYWFSSRRSTEPMTRGSANERVVILSLKYKPFIASLFECGMVSLKSDPLTACSPDVISFTIPKKFCFLSLDHPWPQSKSKRAFSYSI